MSFDPERLLSYPIPEVRQRIGKRDTIFYALSVGLGQDPLDLRQLDFVDHHRRLRALPWMALVLGHPGFWLADPRTGVDPVMVVHGEQDLEIHAPLPIEGEVIGRTAIIGLIDKGPGRGALLLSRKQVLDAASGAVLATTRSTSFLRGYGGFGGPTGPVRPAHILPETAPDIVCDLLTRPEQALYYRLNGDDNPLHADPQTAERARFPRPILHGLCTLGVVGHALLRSLWEYDETRCRGLRLRFTAPVLPGETIRTEVWRDGSFRARVVERDVVVVDNGHTWFTPASAQAA